MAEDGYYWAQFADDGSWTLAEVHGDKVWIIGCEPPWPHSEFHKMLKIEGPPN